MRHDTGFSHGKRSVQSWERSLSRGLVVSTGILLLALSAGCSSPGSGAEGSSCGTSEDCQPGLTCTNHVCTSEGTGPGVCYSDLQCADGKRCIMGLCKTVDTSCTETGICPDGETCVNGQCIADPSDTVDLNSDSEPGDSADDLIPDIHPDSKPDADDLSDSDGPSDADTNDAGDTEPDEVSGECQTLDDCNDSNPCSIDLCINQLCKYKPADQPGCCALAEDCTSSDVCSLAACVDFQCSETPIQGCCIQDEDCDDSDPDTIDQCSNNKCSHLTGTPCSLDSQCDDGDPCTIDSCKSELCLHVQTANPLCCEIDTDCNDNKIETIDKCINNECEFLSGTECTSPYDCDDSNPCTLDQCGDGVCGFGPNLAPTCQCVRDGDCLGSKGGSCVPVKTSETTLMMHCLPLVGTKMAGEACVADDDCISGMCVNLIQGSYCFGGCATTSDCAFGTSCGTLYVGVSDTVDVPVAACVPPKLGCTGDWNCPAGSSCAPVNGEEPGTLENVCLSDVGTKAAGAFCQTDDECKSGLCLDMWEKGVKLCWSACSTKSDCAAGLECYPNVIYFVFNQGSATTVDDTYFGLAGCEPDKGSGNTCTGDSNCPSVYEMCYPYNNQDYSALQPQCIDAVGTGAGGKPCTIDTECKSGSCIGTAPDSFCFSMCNNAADCYGLSLCQTISDFVVNDKGDEDESNDITTSIKVCIPYM